MKNILFITVWLLFATAALQAQVRKVGPIALTVKDMDRSLKFYRDVLGFRKISDQEVYGEVYEKMQGLFGLRMRIVGLQLGEEQMELIDYLTGGGRSIPEDARSNDLFFQHIAIVVSNMEKAYAHLRTYKVEHVSTAPQTIPAANRAAAGIKAFYFHDPDGHTLELIYFPKGKGLPRWQQANGRLFLGIDHTAIAVSQTDSSLSFYNRLLGLQKKGESSNWGTEQEHLNLVEGARLRITGLRAAAGPGIEFLEYLEPGPGRPYPADSRTDDLWHWQTTLIVADAEKLYQELKQRNTPFVSKELVRLKDAEQRLYKAFVIRDPDGHALQLMEVVVQDRQALPRRP